MWREKNKLVVRTMAPYFIGEIRSHLLLIAIRSLNN